MSTSTITELRFSKRPEAVPVARCAIRELLRRYPAEMVDNVELCASEIVTNAIVHSDSHAAAAEVFLAVIEAPDSVRVEVIDDGSHHNSPHVRNDPAADNGHGLFLVENLSDAWGTYADDAGRNVWFHIAIP